MKWFFVPSRRLVSSSADFKHSEFEFFRHTRNAAHYLVLFMPKAGVSVSVYNGNLSQNIIP